MKQNINDIIRNLKICDITGNGDHNTIQLNKFFNEYLDNMCINLGLDGLIHCKDDNNKLIIKLTTSSIDTYSFSVQIWNIMYDELKIKISYENAQSIVAYYICKKYSDVISIIINKLYEK